MDTPQGDVVKNSMAWVRERTIPTERPPIVGEVSANSWEQRVPRGQRDRSLRPYSRHSRPQPLLFLPNSFSVVLTRLSGPLSRPTISQKIWWRRESNPDLLPGTLTTRPQRRSTFVYITYINSVRTSQKHNTSPFCSQELWPLDHRGGLLLLHNIYKCSSYLTGNTIHLLYLAKNSDH
jgi:hypothetical protein